jgi:mycobactin lysine-N-oxygenase
MRLAVIGGGPKAAAIAAKVRALAVAGYQIPELVIFEPIAPGAAWTGVNGYTDGIQPLCTLAERDFGFPYDRTTFGDNVASIMLAEFSWQRFCVAEGINDTLYANWVVQGRQPPAHSDFAAYIASAIRKSQVRIRAEQVTNLDYDFNNQKWMVTSHGGSNQPPFRDSFDGVVVTGSGGSLPPLLNDPRVCDGYSFWTNLQQILGFLRADPTPSVGIIGSGGVAGAVAHWFVREGIKDIPITVIGSQATLYIRVSTPFEDRLFSDDATWSALAPHVRDSFLERLGRGVVWDYVMRRLGDARNIRYRSAYVGSLMQVPNPVPGQGFPTILRAELVDPPAPPGGPLQVPRGYLDATVFIDCRGFNAWNFASLLSPDFQPHFDRVNQPSVTANIDYSLCVSGHFPSGLKVGGPFPEGLHVPMLASVQGPAAPNLMALGWMSDRILSRYIKPWQIIAHWIPREMTYTYIYT